LYDQTVLAVPVLAYGGDDTLVHINVWRGTQV
jgi:hypothetical protein